MIPPFAEYFHTIANAARAYHRKAFSEAGLKGNYGDYIRTICRNPGISQEELCMYVGVDKSNVARTLVQLEQDGYVERRGSTTDRRRVQVFPTDLAYEQLPIIVEIQSDWRAVRTEGLSSEEKEQLADLLARIADNVHRHEMGLPLTEEDDF
jgi:DNA-binding MarR family transcriptional regulator